MKTILVLYFNRGVYPLRDTIETHLYSWRRYSTHRVIYVNVAYGFPERLIRRLSVDAVMFHTTLLSTRWSPPLFRALAASCRYIRSLDCMKIAMPQDEFINTEILNDFINDFGVDHVLTCAEPGDWPVIYDRIDRNRVRLRTVLTGYLDPGTVARIEQKKGRAPRNIDIGYRAWRAEYWLGEHGLHKVRLAERVAEAAPKQKLRTDISMRNEDVLPGDRWFDFLLDCRTTIGVEGGASVLDRRGEIRQRVNAYVKSNPRATFEETRAQCFPDDDHKLGLACISPRHLEACVTETCQLLVEGNYNGILKPWRHYIPIRRDYSNLEAALEVVRDEGRVRAIARQAYEDVVRNGVWTYPNYVREIEEAIVNQTQPRPAGAPYFVQHLSVQALRLLERLSWLVVRLEVWLLAGRIRRRAASAVYRGIRALRGGH